MSDARRVPRSPAPDRARAPALIARLRETLYAAPEWALFDQVRSTTGAGVEVLRTADAIAAHTWGPAETWRLHGLEVKLSRPDWLRELARPEKAAPIKLFCAAWYLVVPAPWKRVVLAAGELPDGWGLLEVGTGDPVVVVEALERDAEQPTTGFLRALLRAAASAQLRAELGADDVPLVPVARALSGQHVGLACGHVLLHPPLTKGRPVPLPCVACAKGLPVDIEVALAAIGDASPADRRRLLAAIHNP